jgi:hypothetical protein
MKKRCVHVIKRWHVPRGRCRQLQDRQPFQHQILIVQSHGAVVEKELDALVYVLNTRVTVVNERV